MALTCHVYTKVHNSMGTKLINYTSDTLKVMLLNPYTVGATQDTAQFLYDLIGLRWTANTAYTTNQLVQPTTANGHIYKVTTPGTTGASEPVWNTTANSTTSNGTVVFTENGAPVASEASGTGYTAGGKTLTGVVVQSAGHVTSVNCSNPSWTSSTIDATHAVFFSYSGSYTTSPLICYWDFGGTESSLAGTFLLTVSNNGLVTFVGS